MADGSLSLALAGHRFLFEPSSAERVSLSPAFDQFLSTDEHLPLTARYTVSAPDRAVPVEDTEPIWKTETWQLGRSATGDFVLSIHIFPDEHPLPVARFSSDFSRGDLIRRAGRHGAATPYAFNYPCDQVAVLNALATRRVCVVHAGAVEFGGQALVFCGRSGAGKTTLSRLCRDHGATLLNDDRQFLFIKDEQAYVAPTPWHGSEPEVNNRTVPLRAILHLDQAPHNTLTPICGALAVARLLGNTVAPFYRADAMEDTLSLLESLTRLVPSKSLAFTPTADAVALCQTLLD
ncbi:MAG: hypothetical protein M5U15_02410 [Kiritimatiellae bacterium]|nr:hypothetical protein [Kiritimatiellia bacterium]